MPLNRRIQSRVAAELPGCQCRGEHPSPDCLTHQVLAILDGLDGDGWLRPRPIPAVTSTDHARYEPPIESESVPALLRVIAEALTNEEWIGPRTADVNLLRRAADMIERGESETVVRADPERPPAMRPDLWMEPLQGRVQFHHPNITAVGYRDEEQGGYDDRPAEEVMLPPSSSHRANLVSSALQGTDLHSPAIDCDTRVEVVPSRTPGHFHLYFPQIACAWDDYLNLLRAMERCGIVESAWVDHSETDRQTLLRVPPGSVMHPRTGRRQSPQTISVRNVGAQPVGDWRAVPVAEETYRDYGGDPVPMVDAEPYEARPMSDTPRRARRARDIAATVRARNMRVTRLDENGEPVGEGVAVPVQDATITLRMADEAGGELRIPAELAATLAAEPAPGERRGDWISRLATLRDTLIANGIREGVAGDDDSVLRNATFGSYDGRRSAHTGPDFVEDIVARNAWGDVVVDTGETERAQMSDRGF